MQQLAQLGFPEMYEQSLVLSDRRHSLSDGDELRRMLVEAGFHDVRVASEIRTIRFEDGITFVHLNPMALVGMSERAQDLSPDDRTEAVRAIVADSQDLIARRTDASGFAYEIGANVATATGGSADGGFRMKRQPIPACLVSMAAVTVLAAGPLAAQDFTGVWSGVADGTVATLRIVQDSGTLHGSVLAPDWRAEAIPFSEIATAGDSIMLTIPAEGSVAVLRGALSADGAFLLGRVVAGNAVVGAFEFAREGTAAAALIAEPFVERPRTSHVYTDPDSAALITSDIELFWDVYDRAPPERLEVWLRREYLNRGTAGLRDFIRGRILSAVDLAARIRSDRSRYEAARPGTERVHAMESQIRATFHALKARYPEAVFSDVYFVIGRFNTGGTVSPAGLLIGAEMYRDPARLPMIVAHELIHYQQPPGGGDLTLLERAFREGSADFVGELISGQRMNAAAQEYGRAHEAELWAEFKSAMHGSDATGWLYGSPPEGRPADLGYFIGYRIAEAYYTQAADKDAALRDILRVADVERILAASGYAP